MDRSIAATAELTAQPTGVGPQLLGPALVRELSQTFLLFAIGAFTLAGYIGVALALVNAIK